MPTKVGTSQIGNAIPFVKEKVCLIMWLPNTLKKKIQSSSKTLGSLWVQGFKECQKVP